VSSGELVQRSLDRLQRWQGSTNAFTQLYFEAAAEEARKIDARVASGEDLGPLAGVPYAAKELFDVAGKDTTGCCRAYGGNEASRDADVIVAMRDAGAILVGKTNQHELAAGATNLISACGPTFNPWDVTRITGGSSGGSAVAVATGIAPLALGTDTGGSIRIPSALCGIVGLKPTYGRVSRYGITPLCWSLDHAGPMAKRVEDVALLLQAMAGYDAKDPSTVRRPVPDYAAALNGDLRGLRIGIPREYFYEALDPEVEGAVRQAIEVVRGLGAATREVSWPSLRYATLAALIIVLVEAAAFHEPWIRTRPRDYHPDIALRLKWGLLLPTSAYLKALRLRALMCQDVARLWREVDVLMTPATAMAAPRPSTTQERLGHREISMREALLRLMRPFNLTGLPAMSIPCGFTSAGLPIGLQIAGKPFDEATVLRVAHAYERATDWHQRQPPMV
jgi:aspartyl-tRNA(Asn)/glutamyl-tRNA(Gln) amidotransferase subunit A